MLPGEFADLSEKQTRNRASALPERAGLARRVERVRQRRRLPRGRRAERFRAPAFESRIFVVLPHLIFDLTPWFIVDMAIRGKLAKIR